MEAGCYYHHGELLRRVVALLLVSEFKCEFDFSRNVLWSSECEACVDRVAGVMRVCRCVNTGLPCLNARGNAPAVCCKSHGKEASGGHSQGASIRQAL